MAAEKPHRVLSIWELMDRLEDRCRANKEVRLRWQSGWILLDALRAYVAHPKTETVAEIICRHRMVTQRACEPLCRPCILSASEVRRLYRGEINPFGPGDWDQGQR